jgi:hypothetical protein
MKVLYYRKVKEVLQMSIQKAIEIVECARGLDDPYSQLIKAEAMKPEATDKAITQLACDIILGITSNK